MGAQQLIRLTALLFVALFGVSAFYQYDFRRQAVYIPTIAQQQQQPSLCMAGAQVSPLRTTPFSGDPGSGLRPDAIAEVSDVFTVKYQSADRCFVHGCNRSGTTCFDGSVRLADLGTVEQARTIMRGRRINQVAEVSLVAFPQRLRDDLAARARSGRPGPTRYDESDLNAVIAMVQNCAQAPDQQTSEALRRRARGDTADFNRFKGCRTEMFGNQISPLVSKPYRNLMLKIDLSDSGRSAPFFVSVLFKKDPAEDAGLLDDKEQSIDAAIANFYEVYGVGNYRVSR